MTLKAPLFISERLVPIGTKVAEVTRGRNGGNFAGDIDEEDAGSDSTAYFFWGNFPEDSSLVSPGMVRPPRPLWTPKSPFFSCHLADLHLYLYHPYMLHRYACASIYMDQCESMHGHVPFKDSTGTWDASGSSLHTSKRTRSKASSPAL